MVVNASSSTVETLRNACVLTTDMSTDIVICEDEDTKEFGAILTCNQNNHTKLLRTETSDSPVKAVRILVDRLQKDTAKLFREFRL